MSVNNRLNWEEYFMSIAFVSSLKSEKAGFVIVKDNKIIFNSTDDSLIDLEDDEKYINRLIRIFNNSKFKDASLYICSNGFPYDKCVNPIIKSGIKKIYFNRDYFEKEKSEAKQILKDANIDCEIYVIDFEININNHQIEKRNMHYEK